MAPIVVGDDPDTDADDGAGRSLDAGLDLGTRSFFSPPPIELANAGLSVATMVVDGADDLDSDGDAGISLDAGLNLGARSFILGALFGVGVLGRF